MYVMCVCMDGCLVIPAGAALRHVPFAACARQSSREARITAIPARGQAGADTELPTLLPGHAANTTPRPCCKHYSPAMLRTLLPGHAANTTPGPCCQSIEVETHLLRKRTPVLSRVCEVSRKHQEQNAAAFIAFLLSSMLSQHCICSRHLAHELKAPTGPGKRGSPAQASTAAPCLNW